jgi:hypothetical protein
VKSFKVVLVVLALCAPQLSLADMATCSGPGLDPELASLGMGRYAAPAPGVTKTFVDSFGNPWTPKGVGTPTAVFTNASGTKVSYFVSENSLTVGGLKPGMLTNPNDPTLLTVALNAADGPIRIRMYQANDPEVVRALEAAMHRGLSVTLVSATHWEENLPGAPVLVRAGAKIAEADLHISIEQREVSGAIGHKSVVLRPDCKVLGVTVKFGTSDLTLDSVRCDVLAHGHTGGQDEQSVAVERQVCQTYADRFARAPMVVVGGGPAVRAGGGAL